MEYSFNNQSYDIDIEIHNDKNSVKLTQNAFTDLTFTEDLFNWGIEGHIVISNRYEMFRKSPDSSKPDPKSFYKYMGNGQDIISIKIVPKLFSSSENQSKHVSDMELPFKQWGLQFEAVIFDQVDQGGDGENKTIKLMFMERARFQLMNLNLDFSTMDLATEGMDDETVILLNNYQRSLKVGDAIYSLLTKADFSRYLKNYGTEKWNKGDDKNKIFYTSPTTQTAYQDLKMFTSLHTSDEEHKFEPIFLKFERNELPDEPKQFSIIPISEYYKKAGKATPMEYMLEHFTLLNNIQHDEKSPITLKKSPTSEDQSSILDVKAIEFSDISSYDFLENQAFNNITQLNNKFPVSFNDIDGQFNFEKKGNTAEEVRLFIEENYIKYLMSSTGKSRISLNKEIKNGTNSEIFYTVLSTKEARHAVARNRLLLAMMFSSMDISFVARGMTIRQPGRFFSISKTGEINDKDFDHRIEGQYLTTNIVHSFKPTNMDYSNAIHGVKFHVYQEDIIPSEDSDNSKL